MLIRNTTKLLDVMEKEQIIGNFPVGEKFLLDYKVLQVIEGSCSDCFFHGGWERCWTCLAVKQHYNPKCEAIARFDKESVAFKLVAIIAPDGMIIPQKELPNS